MVVKVKNFTVTLEPCVVEEARDCLGVGEKLSPILNHLIKDWIKSKKKIKEVLQNGT